VPDNTLVLIDTSAWIQALRPSGSGAVQDRVRLFIKEGRAASCEMVILELSAGTRNEFEFGELIEDLEALEQLPITAKIWHRAYHVANQLRRKGVTVPPADILISAVAIDNGCKLYHQDTDFENIAAHVNLQIWRD